MLNHIFILDFQKILENQRRKNRNAEERNVKKVDVLVLVIVLNPFCLALALLPVPNLAHDNALFATCLITSFR